MYLRFRFYIFYGVLYDIFIAFLIIIIFIISCLRLFVLKTLREAHLPQNNERKFASFFRLFTVFSKNLIFPKVFI